MKLAQPAASLARPGFRGLSGTTLKAIALGLMVLDHIHYFFAFTGAIPLVFTLLGRLAAPIFLYCAAEGFAHTHDRKQYFLRIWAVAAAMATLLFAMIFFGVLVRPDGFFPLNGILMNFVVLMPMWQGVDWLRQRRIVRGLLAILLPLAWPFLLLVLQRLAPAAAGSVALAYVGMALVPAWTSIADGGITFIAVGMVFYCLRRHRGWQMAAYGVLAFGLYFGLGLFTVLQQGGGIADMLTRQYQWMEIFSIPLLLLYNGRRGRGYQKLFYVFYPAHIYLLYALSWAVYLAM